MACIHLDEWEAGVYAIGVGLPRYRQRLRVHDVPDCLAMLPLERM